MASEIKNVTAISSGLFLDKLTGINGIPFGVITEIYGSEGIGKSSACFQLIANAQRQGLRCLFADIEWSYDIQYADSLGVDNSTLGLIRERFAEDALDLIEQAAESGNWDLIILDSIGGLLPRAEAEKDSGSKTIGGQAGLVARFCRKIVPLLRIKNIALVVINHEFTDIMTGKVQSSGGRKLAFHKSLSIRFKMKYGANIIKQGDRKVGKIVVGEVKKNKLAATEGLEIEGQLIFGTGFSAVADLLGDAIDKGVIEKKGTTYWFGDMKLGVGLSKVRKMLEEDKELTEKIKHAMS